MSVQGKLITVFGGGGFLGRYICENLLARGARLRVAQRNAQSAMHIKPLGNLGQVQLVTADVTHEKSVAHAVAGADMVVNLVGSFDNVDAIQHRGAATVAKAAKKAKVAALLHISAIGADAESASRYGRSKGEGENAVRKAFKSAVILRPSIIFGREDEFINRFAGLIQMLPIIPVIGADTKFQPVFVGDVAQAATACLEQPNAHAGKIYEIGGPETFSMLELNQWIAMATGRSPIFAPVPNPLAKIMAVTTGWLPGAPITSDQFKMLAVDNVVTGEDGCEAFGITPSSLDSIAHDWLDLYRSHGRFGDKVTGEASRA